MKIAWFTPLSARTGIARYSLTVLGALPPDVDVEVWAPRSDDDLRVDACPVHVLDDPGEAARATAGCDLRVFNLANHPGFALPIHRVYERSRGLVILHDKLMQDFFYNALAPSEYYRLMTYFYGPRGSDAAVRALADGLVLSEGDFVSTFPLLEACLWNAEGVLTHSSHAAERARERYGALLPVRFAHLPLFEYADEQGRTLASRAELGVAEDRVLVVATGRVAHTKRIDTVIDAIAGSERLRRECQFVSVGEAEPQYLATLEARIEQHRLGEGVRLVTKADDRLLHSYLAAADVCVNLRYPSTEASSATLIEQLYAGKPVIAYDTGVYAEMPDDVLVKVPTAQGVEGVRAALLRLVGDADERASIGRRAEQFARANCAPDVFAATFADFAREVVENRPELAALDARVGSLGTPSDLAALHAAAAAAAGGPA